MRTFGIIAAVSLGLTGAAVAAQPFVANVVGTGTTRVEGWLSTRGELVLFPARNIEAYDPYPEDETRRCVSLINGTGQDRAVFDKLAGKRVVAEGEAVAWDSLADGSEPYDKIRGRKVHGDEDVPNSCVRPFVFLAKRIDAVK